MLRRSADKKWIETEMKRIDKWLAKLAKKEEEETAAAAEEGGGQDDGEKSEEQEEAGQEAPVANVLLAARANAFMRRALREAIQDKYPGMVVMESRGPQVSTHTGTQAGCRGGRGKVGRWAEATAARVLVPVCLSTPESGVLAGGMAAGAAEADGGGEGGAAEEEGRREGGQDQRHRGPPQGLQGAPVTAVLLVPGSAGDTVCAGCGVCVGQAMAAADRPLVVHNGKAQQGAVWGWLMLSHEAREPIAEH